jgi:hypothetical protein
MYLFHPFSIIITALVLAPNLIILFKKPVSIPPNPLKEPVILVAFERLGQLGSFISPVFYAINVSGIPEIIATFGMGLMLCIYYIGWIRFFTREREYRWLFWPLFSIPVPMALCPVVYFLLASVILHSLPLLISSLVLAAGHIPISLQQYKYVKLSV